MKSQLANNCCEGEGNAFRARLPDALGGDQLSSPNAAQRRAEGAALYFGHVRNVIEGYLLLFRGTAVVRTDMPGGVGGVAL
jgi:hypothetical protein